MTRGGSAPRAPSKPKAGGGGGGGGSGAARPAKKQRTLESLAKTVVLPGSALSHTPEQLRQLGRDVAGDDRAAALNALRVLSSLVISTADLEESLVGRAINRVAKRPGGGDEWKGEVARAKAAAAKPSLAWPPPPAPAEEEAAAAEAAAAAAAAGDGAWWPAAAAAVGAAGAAAAAPPPPPPPPPPPLLRFALAAALAAAGCGGAAGALAASLAHSLEAGFEGDSLATAAQALATGLRCNPTLAPALAGGVLRPDEAARMPAAALAGMDFLR